MRYRRRNMMSATTRGNSRGLRIEHLEPRYLLAGDTYLINFQPDEATPVTRYLVDSGLVFGVRSSGFSYGWSGDHTDQSRERSLAADQRFDTLIQFEAGQKWEFQLANGLYEVTVAVGDPANNDGIHTINVEGVNFINAVPDTNNTLVVTGQVTVSDGRLTIDQGAAANLATRIDFVHIVGLPSSPNAAPATPTVTEPSVDGQTVNPSDVHMEASGYSDADGSPHKSTDWEIWTVGPNAEPVWQTLGIQGVEKLHTHLGDGVFMNSRAGQTNLAGNTDYQLRVRFRDDTGSVSSYATRLFHTGPESTVFPLEVQDVATNPTPTWTDNFSTPINLPDSTTILSPTDPILAIDLDGASSSPNNETVVNAIDKTLAKYLNFGEVNSGLIVTPSNGSSIVTGFQVTTANDATERDPTTWQLFGTNQAIASTNHSTGTAESWTIIASGTLALPTARNTLGGVVSFGNTTAYKSYRMVFTGVRNAAAANSMQIAEIEFFGTLSGTVTVPKLRVEDGETGDLLMSMEGAPGAGNLITNPATLDHHGHVRIVVTSGSTNLVLGQSTLSFRDGQGLDRTIYLPAINLPAGQRLDLWVSSVGSTYFGTMAQTEPNFSSIARTAPTPGVPYAITQPGFVIEQVGSGYRLPVNIAFVPNPGPNPTDPLYYVTELYGSIQVVTRDGVKHQFATGLLDYNPTGPISGSGEQGLTGIAVRRDPNNPDVYELYVGMLWDNGSPPGSAVHYPKVERITSTLGGLTMATRTVLLNMQPETQGQSHQISNISFGPDGKLYVHNGDGFDATKGQDLTSFRGKILRMNLDGTAPSDNPFYNASNGITATDYVYAYGLRNPFGGAWRASNNKHYTVENGPSVDRMSQLVAGRNYLYDGSDASMTNFAIYNWSPAVAPVNITFVQRETFGGSQFPAGKMDHAFVSESGPTYAPGVQSNGKWLTEFVLDANGNRISGPTNLLEYIGTGHSSVVALAAGPDGLYFSELYEETGANGATATGARIFRVRYVNPNALDYDIDGDVDNNDYAVWRANEGSNLLLAADGNKNGVVDAGDYVLWRKAMPAGSAAGASVVPLSVAATGNDSATATSTVKGDMPITFSSGMTSGVSAPIATNQLPASASAGAIDMAMGAFRRANVAPGTRRGFIAGKTAPAPKNDETALLMALHKTTKGIEPPSSWLASESLYSDDISESDVTEDPFVSAVAIAATIDN
jgi:glucose/arabinose dehydrogenase